MTQASRTVPPLEHLPLVVMLGALALCLGTTVSAQGPETFKARLSPVPIDVSMQARIAGSGSVTATLAGTKLTLSGNFEGLHSPASGAQLHRGLKGVRGPAVFDLTVSKDVRGTISGTIDLTAPQINDLKMGRFYVQIDSVGAPAPDGNLWGWLLTPPPPRTGTQQ